MCPRARRKERHGRRNPFQTCFCIVPLLRWSLRQSQYHATTHWFASPISHRSADERTKESATQHRMSPPPWQQPRRRPPSEDGSFRGLQGGEGSARYSPRYSTNFLIGVVTETTAAEPSPAPAVALHHATARYSTLQRYSTTARYILQHATSPLWQGKANQ